jgi:restriction endonuclease Mrr
MSKELSKIFYISPKITKNGVLRMSKELAKELSDIESCSGRAFDSNGKEWPITIDINERTIYGLNNWLNTIPKEDSYFSFSVFLESKNPLEIKIDFSEKPLSIISDDFESSLKRPTEGLFLGRILEDQFNDIIPTNEPLTINKNDLLTHAFICGVTGAGKTVLGKALIEEVALQKIPVIAIDLKGDISSLALMFSGEDPKEFIPWVSQTEEKEIETVAAEKAAEHRKKLEEFGFSTEFIKEAKKKINVNIFTPRSNDGFRMALSAFPDPPDNFCELKEKDPDAYESIIDFLAEQFVAYLSLEKRRHQKAKGYVFEIIKRCFENGISMHGYEGVKKILEEFQSSGLEISHIGDLEIDKYISEKDREVFIESTNALLIGVNKKMYEGWPIDIDNLISTKLTLGKTPISIINVAHLDFKDQAYVVGYVSYLIWFYMRKLSGADSPRLVFYIDEIGGGGGKKAFFPSTANSPSKPALNLLLRQGRAYGACCVFATQNPGDIDYKALSNCGIWMVGRLKTTLDRAKIEQGAAEAELEFESIKKYLPSFNNGHFAIKTISQSWTIIEERWLMSIHRPLSASELKKIKENYEIDTKEIFKEAELLYNKEMKDDAMSAFYEIIKNYPFSSLTSRAFLFLAKILIEENRIKDARFEISRLLKRWVTEEERAEAKYLLGTSYEQEGDFLKASENYKDAEQLSGNLELKEQARIHMEYCNARGTWPGLGMGKKIIWWITGKKTNEGELVRLQIKDNEIFKEIYKSKLKDISFSIYTIINYALLEKVKKDINKSIENENAKKIKTRERIEREAELIHELIKEDNLPTAIAKGQKIIKDILELDVFVDDKVLSVIKKLSEKTKKKRKSVRDVFIKARHFEYEITRLFQLMGYRAHVTKCTGDGGVDVFASKDNKRYVIQCKRWKKKIGRTIVDELAGTRERHHADCGILTTTSFFTTDAKKAAKDLGIVLWDFPMLCNLFKKYGSSLSD